VDEDEFFWIFEIVIRCNKFKDVRKFLGMRKEA
jgi:hypothetical protein